MRIGRIADGLHKWWDVTSRLKTKRTPEEHCEYLAKNIVAEGFAVDPQVLREEFLRLLTEDSETKDMRRREYNQAIFDADKGYAIFNGTDQDMVMHKFDKAMKEVRRE